MYNKTNRPAEVGRALNEGGAPMMGLAIALAALLGGFVQSVTGFGGAIVMMLVLPRFLGMLQAPALSASITAALTCGLAWKFRREIDLRTAAVPILTYLASSTVTIRLVGGLDLEVLVLAFGVFLILLSVYFIWFAWNVAIRANFVTASVCGLISGVCTGLFGVGGPLMAIYFLAATDRKETYLASLQFLFAVNNLANLAVRVVCGIYTLDLIPLSIVGILGGHSGPDGGHKGAGPHQY